MDSRRPALRRIPFPAPETRTASTAEGPSVLQVAALLGLARQFQCHCPYPSEELRYGPGIGCRESLLPGMYYAWCDHCEYMPATHLVPGMEAAEFLVEHLTRCCPRSAAT